ncbi:hypothetical protein MtrunA17_Chr5g0429611 [Medicago truncatula]|uniref:Transmembrane protein, putative n=1 Tax=Medicago truncatula TaxID=3880 RepID=G7K6B5_MEDTR|nr:transmembrane protein, putative [Medicago truncatula]RHN56448.1 hypothetical protein MtrunA17_Chr5g0429611 [Medicago truncatula]
MAGHNALTVLSYLPQLYTLFLIYCMFISDFDSNIYACVNASGPLVRNSVTDLDKEVDKLRMKYRSYIVEYDVEDGIVLLPKLFGAAFRLD